MGVSFYCKKCGRMLTVFEERGVQETVCSCGHVNQIHAGLVAGEKIKPQEAVGKGLAVPDTSPGFPHTCKKCGYGECEPTQINAPYSDESDIYLYKCKKCGFVERQADGTGNS